MHWRVQRERVEDRTFSSPYVHKRMCKRVRRREGREEGRELRERERERERGGWRNLLLSSLPYACTPARDRARGSVKNEEKKKKEKERE